MINKHFKINTLITYGANGIVMGSGFILMFMINKYAGVKTYGELAIIISTAGIIASLLTARSGEAVTRFFVREKILNNMQNAKLIVVIGLSVDFILGILVFLFFYMLSDIIASKFLDRPELAWSVRIYGFITISTFVRGSMIGYFQSHEFFRVINSIQILEAVLKVGFLLISFFILNNININYIIYSYILASFFVTLYVSIVFFYRFLKEFKNISINYNKTLIKEYFDFNIKTFFSTTISSINSGIDNLILGYFSDTKTVGIYQILKNILSPTSFITAPFYMMTTSRLTRYYSENNIGGFLKLINIVTIWIIILNTFLLVIIFIFLPEILSYFNLSSIFYSEFLVLSLATVAKRLIWWNSIVLNLYDPLSIAYSSILFFVTFITSIFTVSCWNTIDILTVVSSLLFATVIMVIYSFNIKRRITN